MTNRVLKTIKEHNLIESGDTVLVGLSGGADSIYLLYALYELRDILGINLISAHVNHGVRGEEAKRDEEFSKRVSEELNIPNYITQVDMNGYAKTKGISAEEAGRILRYDFFREVAKGYDNVKIAVAHNRDDQAETVIMRILRGTGLDGLAGIPYKNDEVIRPILDISREEIEKTLYENDIEYVDDHTNFETDYLRNKIRLELIPNIEENYNPNIKVGLVSLSGVAREDVDFIETLVDEKCSELVSLNGDTARVSIEKLKSLHIAIQKRLIRKIVLLLLGSLEGIYGVHIDEIINLLDRQTGKQIDNLKNLRIKTSYGDLIFEKNTEVEINNYEITLEMGINNLEKENISIELSSVDKISRIDKSIAYFDADKLIGPIRVRNRRTGDRIVPIGMSGSKKLKDIFIDGKVDREARDRLPILVDNEKILWVVGLRQSELTKVDTKTVNIIKAEILGGLNE